jgi:hypothetical protein
LLLLSGLLWYRLQLIMPQHAISCHSQCVVVAGICSSCVHGLGTGLADSCSCLTAACKVEDFSHTHIIRVSVTPDRRSGPQLLLLFLLMLLMLLMLLLLLVMTS